jgi:hypothetical protein
LTIYPLKIDKVPRVWKSSTGTSGEVEYYEPKKAMKVELVEKPITITA